MSDLFSEILDDIKKHEGWRSEGYLDHLGNPTIGYGFTWITKEEGELILQNRINMLWNELRARFYWFDSQPHNVKKALLNMAYQMGADGVLGFSRMRHYIEIGEYDKAANEALDSKWAEQTPNRAHEVAGWIRDAA